MAAVSYAGWQTKYTEWKYWNPEMNRVERGDYVRGCVGKLALPSILVAGAYAQFLESRGPRSGKHLTTYICPICKAFHVGNRKGKLVQDAQSGTK